MRQPRIFDWQNPECPRRVALVNDLTPHHDRVRSTWLYNVTILLEKILKLSFSQFVAHTSESTAMKFRHFACLGALSLAEFIEGRPRESHQSSNLPQVDLGYAKYEGTALGTGVNQFLGMRYAAPPVGNRRFRAPEDPLHEYGVQTAQAVSCTHIQQITGNSHLPEISDISTPVQVWSDLFGDIGAD